MEKLLLQQPLELGSLTLQNRLFLPPMSCRKGENGLVTPAFLDHYRRFTASQALGLVDTEQLFVSPEGQSSPFHLSIARDEAIPGLSQLVELIHASGAKVFAQLNHSGSATGPDVTGLEAVSASAVPNPRFAAMNDPRGKAVPRELTAEDIEILIGRYADAAVRAQKAGFDGVEIHCAHAYLLDQFYSPLSNHRTDAYTGATIEGRTLFPRQIARAIRERCGDGLFLSLRWGAADYLPGGAVPEDVPAAAKLFAEAGIQLLNVSGGMCGYDRPGHTEPGWFSELSEAARKASGLPVALAGGIRDAEAAEALLQAGKADLIGIGRAILKDPDLPARLMNA